MDFQVKGVKLNIEIINDKKLKNTYIKIKDNQVIVKGRNLSISKAQEIVEKKADWILKNLEKVKEKNQLKEEKNNLDTISLFGIDYPVEIIEKGITRDVTIYFNQKFIIFVNPAYMNDKDLIFNAILEFYRKRSEIEIPKQVIKWSELMKVSFKGIVFKKMKKTWGSCSHDNNLCFNIKLSSLSYEQIDYIIVHELAHIREKNHSKDFWRIVDSFIPDRKNIHKSLMGQLS